MTDCDKNTIGVTGASGAGKSVVCAELERQGYFLVDCDKTARETMNNRHLLWELDNLFPGFVKNWQFCREYAREKLFSDSELLARYEDVVFPYIFASVTRVIKRADKDAPIVLDAPTLYKSGLNGKCAAVIAVTAPEEMRLARIIARDGITEDAARARMAAYDETPLNRADFTIINNGNETELCETVRDIGAKLRARFSYGRLS